MYHKLKKMKEKNPITEYDIWLSAKHGSEDYLYFIKMGDFIKIGRSKNVLNRMKSLITAMPLEPVLLADFRGRGFMEPDFHFLFKEFKTRQNGEWFHADQRILKFIRWANKHPYSPSSIKFQKNERVWFRHDRLPFGKHKGKLISMVVKEDPKYIVWLSATKKLDSLILQNIDEHVRNFEHNEALKAEKERELNYESDLPI